MALRDYNIEWLRKRWWIPYTSFTGFSQVPGSPTGVGSWGSGSRMAANLNSTAFASLPYTANTDTVQTMWLAPYDLDVTKLVDFRVHWSCNQAANMTWVMKYTAYTAGTNSELVTTGYDPGTLDLGAAIAPATTLDTALPVSAGTTGFHWLVTGFGGLNKNTLTKLCYGLGIQVGATGSLPTTTSFIGLEIRYSTRKTVGPRRNVVGGRRLVDPLGTQWTQTHQEGL